MQNKETINSFEKQDNKELQVRPFVKWVGGKRQLLPEIAKRYPVSLDSKTDRKITTYIEPFVGGGAVLLDILQYHHHHLEKILINDTNFSLITCYRVIQENVDDLISELKKIEESYLPVTEDERIKIYYSLRDEFNSFKSKNHFLLSKEEQTRIAVLFVALNKTCFNGLYRVNKSGEFNVPKGRYKNPTILDESNLRFLSQLLKDVDIYRRNYKEMIEFVDENTFMYVDPPYRPLNKSAAFTAYDKSGFSDSDQVELYEFLQQSAEKGALWMESNSDPKNTDDNDTFFDELYSDFVIERVSAKRSINSDGTKRGTITELLIRNYS